MSFACSKNIINNPTLTIEQFKDTFLERSYNENMFLSDGSLNPKYNSNKKTGLIAQIFEDYWNKIPTEEKNIILRYKPNAEEEIKKIIDCHNKNLGCSVFECPNCHDFIFVGHTCKSRFCTSCGYKYKLNRVNSIVNTAYNCKHRQIVFTCPKELWKYFFVDFDNLIEVYYKAVNITINSLLNESFKKVDGKLKKYFNDIKYTPGFFAFLHTFGRDLKWYPHIHVLIAEIKLGNDGSYKPWNYFNFASLRKRFMRNFLDLMSKKLGPSFNKIKNDLYKRYKDGFYVYAEDRKFKNFKDGVEYITRYCGRPAISENRIINYDGENVTFCYNDHKDDSYHEVTVSAIKFIKILLRHLLPHGFKSIRYYGFYRKKHKIHDKMVKMISEEKKKIYKQLLNWKLSIMNYFHIDPINCRYCGTQMNFLCKISGG